MNLILGGNPNTGVAAPQGGQPHGHGGQRQQPGGIQVTQEEMDAINRLVSFGFSKHKAAEAYFACDKNEELAANFLLESGGDDEDAVMQRTLAESAAEAHVHVQPAAQAQPAAEAQPAAQSNPPSDQPMQQPPSEGEDKKPDDDESSL